MAKKINKKTRNVISGILVGLASLFAIINFAEIPFEDVRNFVLTTLLFILAIVFLALLAVSFFKLLGWLKKSIFSSTEDEDGVKKIDTVNEDQDVPEKDSE